jgi:hypothetical protein
MGPPKESLEKKNVFIEKYDEIRRLDGIDATPQPYLKHSLVTTVFDLETEILICILKTL